MECVDLDNLRPREFCGTFFSANSSRLMLPSPHKSFQISTHTSRVLKNSGFVCAIVLVFATHKLKTRHDLVRPFCDVHCFEWFQVVDLARD